MELKHLEQKILSKTEVGLVQVDNWTYSGCAQMVSNPTS